MFVTLRSGVLGTCHVTVKAIREALFGVADTVAVAVFENIPAVLAPWQRHVAVLPRVEADPAVPAIVVTAVSVALFVAPVVAFPLLALVQNALLHLLLVLDVLVEVVGLISSTRRGLVEDLAALSPPLGLAGALVAVGAVNAPAVLAGVGGAAQPKLSFDVTRFAGKSGIAGTLKIIDQINAGASILARSGKAVIDVLFTVLAAVAFRAGAGVVVEVRPANAAVLARIGFAEIGFILATSTFKSGNALADELVEAVLAGPAVVARTGSTLVDVRRAGWAVEPTWAVALKSGDDVGASSAVVARRTGALIDLSLAVVAGETGIALAEVPVDAVGTFAVDAGVGEALVDVVLAVLAFSSGRTTAAVSGRTLLALAAILAGPAPAFIHRPVTEISSPSLIALTLEGVDVVDATSVPARGVFAVVDVDLAVASGEAQGAVADVGAERVSAGAPVEAGIVPAAVILLHLAVLSSVFENFFIFVTDDPG
jgi:hypothetical protein